MKTTSLKWLPVLLILILGLTGCGLSGPAVGLLSREEQAASATPIVIEKIVVATREPDAARSSAPSQPAPAPTVAAAPIQIQIPEGSDTESELLKAVYRKVSQSVVNIENLTALRGSNDETAIVPGSQGSGFVWDTLGHIVTNDHVVSGSDALQVTFSTASSCLRKSWRQIRTATWRSSASIPRL
jgi:S1-C subfamily serine protease